MSISEPWLDLVYHTLAHLPLPAGDHSSLYAPRYLRWYAERHREHAPDLHAPRLLPDDAPLIADLYTRAPHATLLQSLPRLHPSIDAMLAQAAAPLGDLQTPAARQIARAGEALVELARVALWGEVQAGFREVHAAAIAPLAEAGQDALDTWRARLEGLLPALKRALWRPSLPLLRSGRLFRAPSGAPELHVGLPCDALGVPPWAPALQGAHELLLHHALRLAPQGGSFDPRAKRSGYAAFLRPEVLALSAGARLLSGAQDGIGEAWRAWTERLYPEGADGLVGRLPWASRVDAGASLTEALSSGHALAEADVEVLEALVDAVRSVT